MFYDRKIRYWDYRRGGQRLRGSGFLKLEVRDGICDLSIRISGLHRTDSFLKEVYLVSGGREVLLCTLDVRAGQGVRQLSLPAENLGEGMAYEELEGLRIPLTADCELYCQVVEPGRLREAPERNREPSIAEKVREPGTSETSWEAVERVSKPGTSEVPWEAAEKVSKPGTPEVSWEATERVSKPGIPETSVEAPEKVGEQSTSETPWEAVEKVRVPGTPEVSWEVLEKVRTTGEAETREEIREPERVEVQGEIRESLTAKASETNEGTGAMKAQEGCLEELSVQEVPLAKDRPPLQQSSRRQHMLEDKWKQLMAIYPSVRPFQDQRIYLRLNPEDFVILNNRFYKLVHNSFLLHGYYNYQHLILTRAERHGELCYYIGVPGNFYDREKEVAVMYGFESFECREEPAGEGDYGYYMIRVEL